MRNPVAPGRLRAINAHGAGKPQDGRTPFAQPQEMTMPPRPPVSRRLAPRFATPLLAFGVLGLGAISAPAPAAADEPGRIEYMYSCSACHGDTARGDGPVARYLNVPTPGLTRLAAENDGEFPLLAVIQVIDGRSGLGPHGTMMPVWGARYMASAVEDAGPFGAEVIVRGRILSLARYLESVQD